MPAFCQNCKMDFAGVSFVLKRLYLSRSGEFPLGLSLLFTYRFQAVNHSQKDTYNEPPNLKFVYSLI